MNDSEAAKLLLDEANRVGGSATTCKDGQMIVLRRDFIQRILENTTSPMIVIFIKRKRPS